MFTRRRLVRLVASKGIKDRAMAFGDKIFHVLGLSCLGSAVFLMVYVFYHVALYGGIICIEPNLFIVAWEVGMTALAVVYFGYVFSKTLMKHLSLPHSDSQTHKHTSTLDNKKEARQRAVTYKKRTRQHGEAGNDL